MNLKIKIAIKLQEISNKIRREECLKRQNKFISIYGLTDSKKTKKNIVSYNPYEGTNVLLIDSLIKSMEINHDDYILDVGSGTGLFLIYLRIRGFKNLIGFEIDNALVDISNKNIIKIGSKMDVSSIKIVECDATIQDINQQINIIYIFNSFYDKETYSKFFNNLYKSWNVNKRKMKVIILFPTISSMAALKECRWLIEKGRVFNEAQICSRCVNFLIYESTDN